MSFQRTSSEAPARRASLTLIFTVLIVGLLGDCFSEKIAVNEGLGWDGRVYGSWARDFSRHLLECGTNAVLAQRILPSAVVHYGLRLLSVSLTTPHIIAAFGLVNVALLTLTAWGWCRVAGALRLGRGGFWLGAFGLFGNFAVLKWFAYYPVLTDPWALLLGVGMLDCCLRGRVVGLALLMAAGAFVWPTLIYHGAALLLFPAARVCDRNQAAPPLALSVVLSLGLALLAAGYLLVHVLRGDFGFQSPVPTSICTSLFPHLLGSLTWFSLLSIAGLSIFLFLALAYLWHSAGLFDPACWWRSLSLRGLGLLALLMAGSHSLVSRLTSSPAPFAMPDAVRLFLWTAIGQPCVSWVAHVVFFGPVVLLAFWRWPQVCREIHGRGLGLTLCVTFNVLLSVDSESRHLTHFLPTLVAFTVLALERDAWRIRHVVGFALLSLACSKVWLSLGSTPDAFHAQEFPAQRLFMHVGPWMSWTSYCVQGTVILLVGTLLGLLIRSRGQQQQDQLTGPSLIAPGQRHNGVGHTPAGPCATTTRAKAGSGLAAASM